MVFLVGPVGERPDETPCPGDIRFESDIGDGFDQFQVVHEIIFRIHRYLLPVNLPDGCPEGFALFIGLESQPFLHAVDISFVDFECLQLPGLGVFVLPHLVRAQVLRVDADDHVDIVHDIFSNGQRFVHVGIEHFGHDAFTIEPLGDLQILLVFGPVIGIGHVVQNDPVESLENVVGKHALALIGFRAFDQKLGRPAQIPLAHPFLPEPLDDVGILIQDIDHLGQGLDALFPGHLSGGQFHGFNGCQLLRSCQPREHHRHRCRVIQVGILVQIFTAQRGPGLTSDGVSGQIPLKLVVGVV